jgi:anti-anti-sigma factor
LSVLHAERHDSTPVARVEGEVDASNVGDLGVQLRRLAGNEETALIVDLTATAYIDSAGINLLFALGEELATRRQQLHVVVAEGSPIERMLAITGLARALPTHRTVAEALSGSS